MPPSARHRPALLGALALALGLVGTACSAEAQAPTERRSAAEDGGSARTAGSHHAEAASLCDASGIRCGTAGPADVPYALVSAAGVQQAPGPLVLVEPGGPGLDLTSAVEAAGSLIGDRAVDYLVVGEPWTAGTPADDCLQAVESRLARLGQPAGSWEACAQSWWRPGDRAATVRDVERQLSREVAVVVAASFGAVTALDAAAATDGAPALVLTPAALPGTRRDEVLAARSAVVPEALAHATERPSEAADAVLASLVAAYSPDSREQATELLARWPHLPPDATEQLRRAAFAATYRFGDGAVLPNQVGYLDGFCAAYPVATDEASDSFAERVLADAHPCRDSSGRPAVVATTPLSRLRGCLLVDELDLVTPAAWGRQWAARAPGLRVSAYRSGAHGTPPPAFGAALDELLQGRAC